MQFAQSNEYIIFLLILAPQFGLSMFNVTSDDPRCVTLIWDEPEYPGGPINDYKVFIYLQWPIYFMKYAQLSIDWIAGLLLITPHLEIFFILSCK